MKTPLFLCAIALAGCGTQIGSETDGCHIDLQEAVTAGQVPAGFDLTFADTVEGAFGSFDGTLTLEAGGTEVLTFSLTQDGDPVVERATLINTRGIEIEVDCADSYAVPVLIGLESSELGESSEGTLRADAQGTVTFSTQVELDQLNGSAQPKGIVVADMDQVWFNASGTYATDWTANLSFIGESSSGSGPTGTVSAQLDPYGEFATSDVVD